VQHDGPAAARTGGKVASFWVLRKVHRRTACSEALEWCSFSECFRFFLFRASRSTVQGLQRCGSFAHILEPWPPDLQTRHVDRFLTRTREGSLRSPCPYARHHEDPLPCRSLSAWRLLLWPRAAEATASNESRTRDDSGTLRLCHRDDSLHTHVVTISATSFLEKSPPATICMPSATSTFVASAEAFRRVSQRLSGASFQRQPNLLHEGILVFTALYQIDRTSRSRQPGRRSQSKAIGLCCGPVEGKPSGCAAVWKLVNILLMH